jgi:Uma2 family endonuclease
MRDKSMSITTHISAEQFLAMAANGHRHELVEGEVRSMSPAGFEHGVIGQGLAARLSIFVLANRLGLVTGADTGFLVAHHPDTVRMPDVGFISQARVAEHGIPQGFFPGAPDLAVEVVSPTDRSPEIAEKIAAWLQYGTREVWVVHPRQSTVTLHRPLAEVAVLAEDAVLESPELLPGFRVSVREIFPTA